MSDTPLLYHGPWTAGVFYYSGDQVIGDDANVYVCLHNHRAVNDPPSDSVRWQLLTTGGAPGATGPRGATGSAGATGATGPAGPISITYRNPRISTNLTLADSTPVSVGGGPFAIDSGTWLVLLSVCVQNISIDTAVAFTTYVVDPFGLIPAGAKKIVAPGEICTVSAMGRTNEGSPVEWFVAASVGEKISVLSGGASDTPPSLGSDLVLIKLA